MKVKDIREIFKYKLNMEEFTIDKTGAKTIEILGASFEADEDAIFGTPNQEYITSELLWYAGMSTNINDIYPDPDKEPPAAWKYAADKYGNINSNYGKLIFSPQYYNQFDKAVDELVNNPDSRRSIMIYNRPSIWTEFDENGKSDFICTNAVCYYIRDEKLHAVVQMRSNDAVYGYKNDVAWAFSVLGGMTNKINKINDNENLDTGNVYWQVQNLHVYEKHFHLVK